MKTWTILGLTALCFSLADACLADPVETNLTASSSAYSADLPSWGPEGETIIYTRYWHSNYYRKHLYTVQGDASGVSETLLSTVPAGGANFPSSLSWIGGHPIMSEQAGTNFEYLSIDPATVGNRTIYDGDGQGYTVKLKCDTVNVPGWGLDPEAGDMVRISRDGSTALIRWASAQTGSPNYQRTTRIYTGPVSSMLGQFISKNGVDTDWEDQPGVLKHIETTQHYLGLPYTTGAALTPDGSKFVISDEVSIWLYTTDGSEAPVRIITGTPGATYNLYPDITPDGTKLIYFRSVLGNVENAFLMANLDGSNEEVIFSLSGTSAKWPTVSPEGTRMAYIKDGVMKRLSGIKAFSDCNANDIPDACDVPQGSGTPAFCAHFCGTPGLCPLEDDCNNNSTPDLCDPDLDGDGTPNDCDDCPTDPLKSDPGVCGCGIPDADEDGDGTFNCIDLCPTDPLKVAPLFCGCGVPDADDDGDAFPNCIDECPGDFWKTEPELCGCGVDEIDWDLDGTPDCLDGCPEDEGKIAAGICGCGMADRDSDLTGIIDCLYGEELKFRTRKLQQLVKKLKPARTKAQKAALKANSNLINQYLNQMNQICRTGGTGIQTTRVVNLLKTSISLGKTVKKALKVSDRNFAANKKAATKALASFLKLLV